jgi:WD40 repeat protein
MIASGGDGKDATLWDITNGRVIAQSQTAKGAVTSLAFSPDGAILAAGSQDKKVFLLEVVSFKLLRVLDRHTEGVLAVAYAPDGKQLASVGKDNRVVLWDTATGQPTTLPGDSVNVHAVAFSPDGRFVVFGSGAALRVWDRQNQAYVKASGP